MKPLSNFAIDFGATNTVVASDRDGSVAPVAVRSVMADRTGTPVIPSAVYFPEDGRWPQIGQAAIHQNLLGLGRRPNFAECFKRHLGRESQRSVARIDGADRTARQAAEAFFTGLRIALREELRPRRKGLLGFWDDWQERRSPLLADLTLTAPVDADELYRRELAALGRRLGARTLRLVDEPVAAALGYGVNVGRELTVLVLDWGGGTLDVSVVRTGPRALTEGRAEVLAKSETPVGGTNIDRWIVERFLIPVERYVQAWEMDAGWAAAQAKEAASIYGRGQFQFRDRPAAELTRGDLMEILEARGAYASLERALGDCLESLARKHGMNAGEIDEALLVGGSSLLPGVDERVRSALSGSRVGEWNPFAAVATGACELARGGSVTDQIYHDYALRLADDAGKRVYYELIIPAGTQYPTPPTLVERAYLPDPGRPEELRFEICEIARLGRIPVPWHEEPGGECTWRPDAPADLARALVINEGQEWLSLPPSRRNPRLLRVSYRIDTDRCLRWTVRDGDQLLRADEVLGRLR